jgi:tyrosyl-tRNA synthetase
LAKEKNVTLQLGGADQWSNIAMGVSLSRKLLGKEVHGLTFPLLTKSDGTKFGKTESGAIWLNAKKTSPFEFFQFFIKVEDKDVVQLLKWLTFLSKSEIDILEESLKSNPEQRLAQKALARELTSLVHGELILKEVELQIQKLFGNKKWTEATEDLSLASTDVMDVSLVDLLVKTGLSSSKGAARRDIEGGGIRISDIKVSDVAQKISLSHLSSDRLILRKGKSNFKIIKVT